MAEIMDLDWIVILGYSIPAAALLLSMCLLFQWLMGGEPPREGDGGLKGDGTK